MANSRSFLANQKARNAIVGAENLLNKNSLVHNVAGQDNNHDVVGCESQWFLLAGLGNWLDNPVSYSDINHLAGSDTLNIYLVRTNCPILRDKGPTSFS